MLLPPPYWSTNCKVQFLLDYDYMYTSATTNAARQSLESFGHLSITSNQEFKKAMRYYWLALLPTSYLCRTNFSLSLGTASLGCIQNPISTHFTARKLPRRRWWSQRTFKRTVTEYIRVRVSNCRYTFIRLVVVSWSIFYSMCSYPYRYFYVFCHVPFSRRYAGNSSYWHGSDGAYTVIKRLRLLLETARPGVHI